MGRRVLLFLSLLGLSLSLTVAGSSPGAWAPAFLGESPSLVGAQATQEWPTPVGPVLNRGQAWTPKPAGTRETLVLQYGPYVVHPGSDLPRADVEAVVGANGYVIGAAPVVRDAEGAEPSLMKIHIHHAHWMWPDPEQSSGYRWFYGTGEEQTQGSIEARAMADPRFSTEKLRYGIRLQQGETLAFLSMLHNKSSETLTVWLEARLEFVYGTREEIKAATGEDFHHVTPRLHGETFNVPRTGGIFAWPRDATAAQLAGYPGSVLPDIGHTWTSPFDGTIIVGAGHMHPGGQNVVVSNLGSPTSPCGGTYLSDPDGDGFKGVPLVRSRHITRDGVVPSEDFQMGITQPGWRARVRAGDVIAINGVYDATSHAYPDAMSFFGFYTDLSDTSLPACSATLIDAPAEDHTFSVENRPWDSKQTLPVCATCDVAGALPGKGPKVNVIQIAGFNYLPGNRGLDAPVVSRAQGLTFFSADAGAGIRHTVTSCPEPCNGGYFANYPFPDGRFESGVLGPDYQDLETYVTASGRPDWTFDTGALNDGLYRYFCRLHPWMRGAFYVEG